MTDDFDALDSEQFADGFDPALTSAGLSFDGEEMDAHDDLDLLGDFEDFDGFDAEGDAFFKKMFRKIGRGLKKFKFLRKLAPLAGRIAGGFFGGPIGAKIGGKIGGMLREDEDFDGLDDFDAFGADPFEFEDFDGEDESEDESLREDEAEAFGLNRLTDGMAEELGGLAAETESEAEASALLGGVTIQIVSPAPVTVKRMAPVLVKSATRLGRFLRKSRRTRMLVRTIPTIQKRATRMLVKRAKQGGKITPVIAKAAMAKATVNTLRTPRAVAKSLANNVVKRRRFRMINKKAVARAEQ